MGKKKFEKIGIFSILGRMRTRIKVMRIHITVNNLEAFP